ncbi:MAG: HlyD family efflux transporter periplasmic adaptor subunit [Alistipes senegalensis]|nr:HlyD family efflux transporter periplasmic adaptor subunit [Oxalobacter formigenes]MCM1281665.1 HlyD family efflux transporter periplasmic adaptor subunit [Alistipes senegalensis]
MSFKLPGSRLAKIAVLAAIVAAVGAAAWAFLRPPAIPEGFAYGNGRLEATETAIASKIQGKIVEVRFREGADLKAGEIAAVLDGEDVKARLRAAEADLIRAQEAARESRENVKTAQSEQELAVVTYRRTEELIRKNFISKAQLDKDKTTLDTAAANLAGARNRVSEADAAVESAQANVEALKVGVDDTLLRVPVDGRVLYRLAEPGEVVSAGGRVLAMIDLSDIYMYIYLNTEEAGKVVIGDAACIMLDALPNVPIPAHVAFVAPKNQFTPKEVETREERIKFMFRVKLKIDREWLDKNSHIAKPGMPGIGWVRIRPGAPWPANLPKLAR